MESINRVHELSALVSLSDETPLTRQEQVELEGRRAALVAIRSRSTAAEHELGPAARARANDPRWVELTERLKQAAAPGPETAPSAGEQQRRAEERAKLEEERSCIGRVYDIRAGLEAKDYLTPRQQRVLQEELGGLLSSLRDRGSTSVAAAGGAR
jgi:hypothetical protein